MGLGFIEPRAMIIAKALFHCSMHAAIQTEKCIFLSWAALLRCGPLAQPSPARPAQHGPAWPNWTQPRPTTSTNCKSKQLFFWQNRNVHDEGRAKWEHWTLLWHSYQQRGSPMHSKVPSLMQIKYVAAANFFFVAPAANVLLSLYIIGFFIQHWFSQNYLWSI